MSQFLLINGRSKYFISVKKTKIVRGEFWFFSWWFYTYTGFFGDFGFHVWKTPRQQDRNIQEEVILL